MAFDVNACRNQFPALVSTSDLSSSVYLDNAATTHKPQIVLNALLHHYQNNNANVHRSSHHLGQSATASFEQARDTVQSFINATQREEIIWTGGTTDGINLLANTWGKQNLQSGDRILLSAMEHHANFVPWQQLAKEKNLFLDIIPVKHDYTLDLDALKNLITNKTKLIAVCHVSNVLGTINPVQEICSIAQANNITCLIDGAQAVAHMDVDLQTMGCDFYVFSGHKLFAPTGIGVLYGRHSLLESMPVWKTGGEMVNQVGIEHTDFQAPPLKFEAGTPAAAEAIALAEAIRFTQHMRQSGVQQHEQLLEQYLRSEIQTMKGITLHAPKQNHCAVFSLTFEHHHQDIAHWLNQKGIAIRTGQHCAMPLMQHLNLAGTLRVSLSLYNTKDDIDRLICALQEACELSTEDTDAHDKKSVSPSLLNNLKEQTDWQSRYRLLLLAGKKATRYPDIQTDEYLVAGCESKTWLCLQDKVIRADSDAKIMRGILVLIIELYQNDLLDNAQAIFKQLGFSHHLSQSRNNGISELIKILLEQS